MMGNVGRGMSKPFGIGVSVGLLVLLASLAALGAAWSRPDTAASTATPATAKPALARATARPQATAPVAASPAGEALIVRNTGGEGVSLRRAPGDGERITVWADG